MSPGLLVLLLLLIVLSAVSYYYGFASKEYNPWRWRLQAGFFVFLLLTAFIIWGLLRQSNDQSRLHEIGITPHPAIEHSIGVPAGPGIDPTWVFKSSAPRETILDFYRQEKNRPGWIVISDGYPVMLVLEKDGRVLTIGATEEPGGCSLSFLLSK